MSAPTDPSAGAIADAEAIEWLGDHPRQVWFALGHIRAQYPGVLAHAVDAAQESASRRAHPAGRHRRPE